MDKKGYKFYLVAELDPVKETKELRQEVASVIELPDEDERQPDLSYFSSIFVSTGTNLNNAHFLASELIKAENTVVGKAVDIEHIEDQIIGHIYKCAFTDKAGNQVDVASLKGKKDSEIDQHELHIEIASVVYKTRFPEIAKEIADHKWKVSMEVYYKDYDVLIGDTIITKNEAKALGLDLANEANFGKYGKLIKGGKVVAEGTIARVLRGLCFSGVGIVKNPANPPSVVLEATASTDDEDVIILDDSNIKSEVSKNADNNVTNNNIDNKDSDSAELQYNDTVGMCVNYHKELNDSFIKDEDSKVIAKQVCTKYNTTCPTYGDATDVACLRNVVKASIEEYIRDFESQSNIKELTDKLLKVLSKVNKRK